MIDNFVAEDTNPVSLRKYVARVLGLDTTEELLSLLKKLLCAFVHLLKIDFLRLFKDVILWDRCRFSFSSLLLLLFLFRSITL